MPELCVFLRKPDPVMSKELDVYAIISEVTSANRMVSEMSSVFEFYTGAIFT